MRKCMHARICVCMMFMCMSNISVYRITIVDDNFLYAKLELSRRNFNLDVVDIYFVHNPEIQLNVVPRQTVLSRIKNAFAALEECVKEGKITMYGVASWNAFRTNSSAKLHLSLEELVHFAKEVGMVQFFPLKVLGL